MSVTDLDDEPPKTDGRIKFDPVWLTYSYEEPEPEPEKPAPRKEYRPRDTGPEDTDWWGVFWYLFASPDRVAVFLRGVLTGLVLSYYFYS